MIENNIKKSGILNLAGYAIPCYVTEDGTRLLSGSKTQEALKISEGKKAGTRISKFLSSRRIGPTVARILPEEAFTPIICYQGEKKVYAYHAEDLGDICDAMLEARKTCELSNKQKIVADQCEILMRAFAKVGITALIDEATGYQSDRDKDELQKILAAYISDEVAKWQMTFSNEFYKELYRIYNIQPSEGHSKPLRVGLLTAKLIYDQLPEGVFEELKAKTGKDEKGRWKHQLHRSLTESVGRRDLKRIINEVTALMAVSDNKEQFKLLYERRFNNHPTIENSGTAS